ISLRSALSMPCWRSMRQTNDGYDRGGQPKPKSCCPLHSCNAAQECPRVTSFIRMPLHAGHPTGSRPTYKSGGERTTWKSTLRGSNPMKRITFGLAAIGALAGMAAYIAAASGQADGEAAPIYEVKIPSGYRDWQLISVNHLAGGTLKQLRAQLGNDIALKAFR